MVTLPTIVGTNQARAVASPCRIMIAAVLGVLLLALFVTVPLAAAGMERQSAHDRAEARI